MFSKKISIDLDFDQISEMVRVSLMEDYKLNHGDDQLQNALDQVIDWYSTPEQYQQWVKEKETL